MHNFTPYAGLVGGVLIGLASSALLLLNGRVAGISGIVGTLIRPVRGDVAWRLFFIAGLLAGGLATALWRSQAYTMTLSRSTAALIAAGVLVGFGTRLGNGCTSGHGVCGIGRLSPRSIVATVTFIAFGAITVGIIGRFFGGAL
jgi:uncharacterized protein